jgi:hypothetical protein
MDNLLLLIYKFHMQWWYLLQKLKASGYILYENVADRIPYIKFFKGRFPAHVLKCNILSDCMGTEIH